MSKYIVAVSATVTGIVTKMILIIRTANMAIRATMATILIALTEIVPSHVKANDWHF